MKPLFTFIACTNQPRMMEECQLYIDRLYVPEGWRVETIIIDDAASMTSGYNRAIGMRPGDKIKRDDVPIRIYLHQDVFIMNRFFLLNLKDAFDKMPETGMIGMAGTPAMDTSGIMWAGSFIGNFYIPSNEVYKEEENPELSSYRDVVAIDGFLMATQIDIPWREDLFDGFDFYDVSQSYEFRKRGFKIKVPEQKTPWCVHDGGMVLSMTQYNHYRRIFLNEYGKEL